MSVASQLSKREQRLREIRSTAPGEDFYAWLMSAVPHDDFVGDLARDFQGDVSFPRHVTRVTQLIEYAKPWLEMEEHASKWLILTAWREFQERNGASSVYFIRAGCLGGPIKIGVAKGSLRKRLAVLQTGNSERLQILTAMWGTREDEQKLHDRFAAHRKHGEWFASHEELLEFVKMLQLEETGYDFSGELR